MPRSAAELTRHQILLAKGDWEKLQHYHRNRTTTEVIRLLVQRHLREMEVREREKEQANAI